MKVKTSDEYESLVPRPSKEEYEALKADIAANGVQVALIVNQAGILLDGYTRWQVIQELGVAEYPVEAKAFDAEWEEKIFVVDINLHRRHLTPMQRGELVLLKKPFLAEMTVEKEKKRMESQPRDATGKKKPTSPILGKSANIDVEKELAKQANVSKGTLHKIEKIVEAAKTDPEIAKAKNSGKSVHAVYKKVQQKEKERRKVEPPVILPENSERCSFYVTGVADLEEVGDASVDWIITDPPYKEEYLPVYEELAKTAKRVLKEGGGCLVMCGQSYLPEVIKRLGKHLIYHWCVSYLTPGGQAVQQFARKVNTFWKPVLWFVKGEYEGDWVGDVTRSDVNDNDKRFHDWGQSESGMADIVYRFTNAGEVILDPFVGGGTTAYVTLKMEGERRFIGSDIDPEMVKKTRERVVML